MNYEKDEFKKKLCSVSGRNIVSVAILVAIAIVVCVLGLFVGKTDYKDFSSQSYGGGYAKVDVKFLMGPFAEQTKNGNTANEYYLAEAEEGGWIVVGTGAKTSIPVYGVDVFDDDLDGLKTYTLKGQSTYIDYRLGSYVEDFFTEAGYDVSGIDTSQYVGDYYLDTTEKGNELSIAFLIIAGILVLVALISFIIGTRKVGKIKKAIASLEDNGQFDALCEDFAKSKPIYSSACKLAVSDNYVINFTDLKNGVSVIPLQSFNNVFRCNMTMEGNPTSTSYLAVEDENRRYFLTSVKGNTKKLDEIVAYMKTSIRRETM